MKNQRFFFDAVFFLIAAGEIASHSIHSEILHFIFKPLLLIWLLIYFIVYTKENFNSFAKLISAGFLFSWLGDVFLMFDHNAEQYFLFGLFSFLCTHVCYILAFLNSVKSKEGFLQKKWFYALPFVLAGTVNIITLYPKLGTFAIPTGIYGFAIITMVLCALNRKSAVSEKSFRLIFSGAISFMISDSILSANKFLMEIPLAEIFIMTTYIAAQYLIMRGSIVYLKEKNITS